MAKEEFDFELEPIDDEVDKPLPAPVPEKKPLLARPRRVDPSLENRQTKIIKRRQDTGSTSRTLRVQPRGPSFIGKLFRFLIVLLIGFAAGAAATVYVQTERQELYEKLLGIAGLEKPPADEAESNAEEKAQTGPATNAQPSAAPSSLDPN